MSPIRGQPNVAMDWQPSRWFTRGDIMAWTRQPDVDSLIEAPSWSEVHQPLERSHYPPRESPDIMPDEPFSYPFVPFSPYAFQVWQDRLGVLRTEAERMQHLSYRLGRYQWALHELDVAARRRARAQRVA